MPLLLPLPLPLPLPLTVRGARNVAAGVLADRDDTAAAGNGDATTDATGRDKPHVRGRADVIVGLNVDTTGRRCDIDDDVVAAARAGDIMGECESDDATAVDDDDDDDNDG